MKTLFHGVLILFLLVALGAGCSQNSGTEEQAAAPQVEPSQPQLAGQAQPSDTSMQPMEQQQAAMPAPEAQQQEDMVADGRADGQPQEQPQSASAEPAADQSREISGTVVRTEDGIALFSDAGHYLVEGQQLDDLVGKNVKVTGTLNEDAEKPTIAVISFTVIETE